MPRITETKSTKPSKKLEVAQSSALERVNQEKTDQANQQKGKIKQFEEKLNQLEQNRQERLEVYSDKLVYLTDESIFMDDLLALTQQKKSKNPIQGDVMNDYLEAITIPVDLDWEPLTYSQSLTNSKTLDALPGSL